MTAHWDPLAKRQKSLAERFSTRSERSDDKPRKIPGIKRSGEGREVAQMSLNDFAKSYEPVTWGFGGGDDEAEFQMYENDQVILRVPFTSSLEPVVFTLIAFIEREREMVRLLQRRIDARRESGASRRPVKRELVLEVAAQLAERGVKRDRNFASIVRREALKKMGHRVDEHGGLVGGGADPLTKRYVRQVLNTALAAQGHVSLDVALAAALNKFRKEASAT